MKKLLSFPSLLVLSVLFSTLCSYLYGRDWITYIVSIFAASIVCYYSEKLLIRPNDSAGTGAKVICFAMYASIAFGFYGTFFQVNGKTVAYVGSLTFNAETVVMSMLVASLLGIIFWLGNLHQENHAELKEIRREYKETKERMEPAENGMIHYE